MSADAFRRLAVYACSATIAGGIMAVAVFVSVWVALGALLGGLVLTTLATLELRPATTQDEEPEPEDRPRAITQRPLDEIRASARRAREEDEDEGD